MKNWVWFVVAKAAVLGAVGIGFALAPRDAFSQEGSTKDDAASSEAAGAKPGSGDNKANGGGLPNPVSLPVIPKNLTSLTEAERIRLSLELMRRDVETKIKALAQAKASYDRARKGVEKRLAEVKEQKQLLDETLQHEKETKEERLKEALSFVEKMEPRKSAPVVEAMDRDLVVALFKRLPARNVTRILENVSPRKATEFMEYYTRIRSGREFALLRELGLCKSEGDSEEKKPSGESGTGKKTGETPGTQRIGSGPQGAPSGAGEAGGIASGKSDTAPASGPGRAQSARAGSGPGAGQGSGANGTTGTPAPSVR